MIPEAYIPSKRCVGPTARQRDILDFVRAFQQSRHYVPSVREIAEGVGLSSSSSVQNHLDSLESKGIIWRLHGQASRTIVIVGDWTV